MSKIPYIVTAILIVVAGLFAILNKFWAGFVYFVLAMLLVLSLFWAGWFLFKYFTDFKVELEEGFKLYKAEKINTTSITTDAFEQNEKVYRKQYKKSVFKTKFIKWFQIAFCLALAVTFILGMVFI